MTDGSPPDRYGLLDTCVTQEGVTRAVTGAMRTESVNSITSEPTHDSAGPRVPASTRIRTLLARVLAAPALGAERPADGSIRVSAMSFDWLRAHEGESVKHDP